MIINVSRGMAIIIAILFSAAAFPQMSQWVKDILPAKLWFVAEQMSVPDFKSGEDPDIMVRRWIAGGFQGDWIVEVRDAETDLSTTCNSVGQSNYKQVGGEITVKLFDWWMSRKPCDLNPGNYYVFTKWKLSIPGYNTKFVELQSNVFEVKS